MEMVMGQIMEGEKKKRGRKKKGDKAKFELNMEQEKFYVDLSKSRKMLEKVQKILVEANDKEFGEEVTFRELAIAGIKKLTDKDIEKIRDNSISFKEKLEIEFNKYKESNEEDIDFWEFLNRYHKQK
ncbi:MAG: hypothetical protein CME62_13770 [Halobacteriovoraceae bacterium]|nr:hypothetical protein [Halobacteriovoraceae bacterium]|tara:strand:+ start:193 stop:573 length:381 start_codon:yes stop_codon:yes gene_type:complete